MHPTILIRCMSAAVKLIKKGKAYVCDLTAEQIREYRGTLTEPGKNSPYRDRSVEENLELFEEYERTANMRMERRYSVQRSIWLLRTSICVIRLSIVWLICPITIPGINGAFIRCMILLIPSRMPSRGITHSICTLEFEDHRPLYDWVVREL